MLTPRLLRDDVFTSYSSRILKGHKVKNAIKKFVQYVQKNEPGTQMCLAGKQKGDPTRFLHLFIFADADARTRHGKSEAVKDFECVYTPELVGGKVVFTEYEIVAGKLGGENVQSPQALSQNEAHRANHAKGGVAPWRKIVWVLAEAKLLWGETESTE